MKAEHPILAVAFALPVLAFFWAWNFAPPILNTDSATGFQVWETLADGGPWNSVVGPDPADIARDTSHYIAWWSPGQYLVPGVFRLLVVDWLPAALLTTLAAVLATGFGAWKLARALDLSPEQAALAALLCTTGCGALNGFGMFWGGDILLAAATPFLFLAALRIRTRPTPATFAAFCGLCLAALFCKHGGVLAIAGALAFCGVESLRERGARFIRDPRLWLAVSTALLAYLLSRFLWVGAHPTPGSPSQAERDLLATTAFSLNGPWFSLTGAGSLVSGLFQHFGRDYDDTWTLLATWLLALGLATSGLVAWLGLRRAASRPWRLAACAWLATAGLLALLYLRGASASIEERHFRAAAAPLAVALAATVLPLRPRSLAGLSALAIALFTVGFGISAHVRRVGLLTELPRGLVSGFTQPDLTAEDARSLHAACPPNATLVLTHPSHAFEFPGSRLLVTDAFFRDQADISRLRFGGVVPNLAIAIPRGFEADGRGPLLRAAFIDIPAASWQSVPTGAWNLWTAGVQPAEHPEL